MHAQALAVQMQLPHHEDMLGFLAADIQPSLPSAATITNETCRWGWHALILDCAVHQ